MISNIIKKKEWLKMMEIKKCKANCLCENRIQILLQKIPMNIIDEVFIKFRIKEQISEYKECYKNK